MRVSVEARARVLFIVPPCSHTHTHILGLSGVHAMSTREQCMLCVLCGRRNAARLVRQWTLRRRLYVRDARKHLLPVVIDTTPTHRQHHIYARCCIADVDESKDFYYRGRAVNESII